MQANERTAYYFRGAEEEIVPSNIQTVVVDPNVKELPWYFRNQLHRGVKEVVLHEGLKVIGEDTFRKCNLQRISIYTSTQVVSARTFEMATSLEKVDFLAPSTSSSDELTVIEEEAFADCSSLQRITIPSTVKMMGKHVFADCSSLVVANLSLSRMKMISPCTFEGCRSLQAVCLPNSVECIGHFAFRNCFFLVTVEIPPVEALVIQGRAFSNCTSLANICLPENHSSNETSFEGCTLLEVDEELEDFDETQSISSWSCQITTCLVSRLLSLPIHNHCYHSSTITCQEFLRFVNELSQIELVSTDMFNMTSFHVLCSSVEPRQDFFEILLEQYPRNVLGWKDANGKLGMEYFLANWTPSTKAMFVSAVEKWMLDPLNSWGIGSRCVTMAQRVQNVVNADSKESRSTLWNEACCMFELYETLESVSVLEMALWKKHIKSGCWNDSRSKKMALDRHQCLLRCGSGVVLPNIGAFLGLKVAPSNAARSYRLWEK